MTAKTGLELRVDPFVDLYFSVRAQAADLDEEPAPGYGPAVGAARSVQEMLGSFGGWGPLDSQVFELSPAEVVEAFSSLPEPYERRGRSLSLRGPAVRLAEAVEALMPGFLAGEWPTRRSRLEARVDFLEREFIPRHREALAHMMSSLGISDPGSTVPMYLVTTTNPPGAMTYYLHGGRQVSVLAVGVGGSDSLLMETLLHEATHTLDLASRESGSVFGAMRQLLEDRGLSRGDNAYHDIPHTLMFIQAAETMRRVYDPAHVAYGDATDLYERSGEIAVVELAVWPRYLAGELSRDEALRRIVEALDPRPGD